MSSPQETISWSDVDLAKCREARIAVITDDEIDYYAALVQRLKHAARYQFLARTFGGRKSAGLGKLVVATRGNMGDDPFYTFLISPDELLKIAYVAHKRAATSKIFGHTNVCSRCEG